MARLLFLIMLLLLAVPAWASLDPPVIGTLQNAAVATGNGTEMAVPSYATIGLQVVIETTATVTFEATIDATNWIGVLCSNPTTGTTSLTADASGLYQCNVAGYNRFRARISSYGAGTVTVKGLVTTAKTGLGAGGGVASEADTLDTVFDRGKVIDGANSLANAFRFGDGVTPWCGYTDATDGPVLTPCTDANVSTRIPTNFTWALRDVEGAAAIETVDPDAASTLAMWTYGAAYRPKKSVWFGAGSLSTDGTQCAAPAEVTLASGPKTWTILCTDNDASTIYGNIRMPDSWDGGTVTFTHVYVQTAADTGPINGDITAQCRGNGEAVSNTWGTEIAIDDAAVVGTNSVDQTTSAAVTPNGTCAAGDLLWFRYQLDATGTTTAVATLHHLGFNMEYSAVSRSD